MTRVRVYLQIEKTFDGANGNDVDDQIGRAEYQLANMGYSIVDSDSEMLDPSEYDAPLSEHLEDIDPDDFEEVD